MEHVEWGEYKLEDLFEIIGTKSLDSNAINFVDIGINFVGRTFENNGIQGKIEKQSFEPNEPFTITATVIGNYKYVKFQKESYYCSQNINKLTPKPIISKWNEKIAYYFIANIQKFVSLYDYQQGGYKLEDIKNYTIKIPNKNGAIDFEFMDKFIAELEAERLAELEAYLLATWLKDYILTDEEKHVLEEFESGKVEWKKFRIGELFDVATWRDVIIWKVLDGNIPLISHQHENNWITKKITQLSNRRLFNFKNTLPLADRGVFLATTQNENFHIGTRVKALTFKDWEKDVKNRLFFVASINRLQILFTEYSNNATGNLPNLSITLPAQNNQPNYDIMEILISAIQKLVIKDVVLYADKKIDATREMMEKSLNHK